MRHLSRRDLIASFLALPALADEWTPLFNGRNLDGWKAGNMDSFKVVDGAIATDGKTSHLFYTGPVRTANFKNFIFRAEVKARHLANSGIYFHTRFQESGFPDHGFEIQVNNTAAGEGNYRERKKTASLYAIRDVYKQFVADDEWFRLEFEVRGKRVQVKLNDMLVVDFIEPDPPVIEKSRPGRVLSSGTFAIQCHDPGSKAFFRNLAVKPLPDDLPTVGARPVVDDAWREILELHEHNYPVVDYHVHLKGGFTLEQALEDSRRTGIAYGLAVNCGKGFPVGDDAGAEAFFKSMDGQPVFIAMQAEGREWLKMFSPRTISKFDYVFTDAMTWTDDQGKRMRLWIPEEVGEIGDRQRFMDLLVKRTAGILSEEPIDIWANPTFLPDSIARDYAALWTEERMDRVIDAAQRSGIAIEINNRYRIPSAAFIKRAKAAGVKFSFGSNNADRNFGRIDYGREMVKQCSLGWQDFFVPKAKFS
jgi:hypothetical protein